MGHTSHSPISGRGGIGDPRSQIMEGMRWTGGKFYHSDKTKVHVGTN
jgi:hypothetical protein